MALKLKPSRLRHILSLSSPHRHRHRHRHRFPSKYGPDQGGSCNPMNAINYFEQGRGVGNAFTMRHKWRLLLPHNTHKPPSSSSSSSSSSYLSFSSPCKSITSSPSCNFVSSTSNPNSNSSPPSLPNTFSVLSWLFAESGKQQSESKEHILRKVSILRNELVKVKGDSASVYNVLQQLGLPLFCSCYYEPAFFELLAQLYHLPNLGLEVLNWRRKHPGLSRPITSEEYAKGITLAGRARNVDIAVEIFNEAANNGIKTSSTYNALMGVYMFNGFPDKCQALFREFKMDEGCYPTTVTYNILISVFGRLMLIDHMEATFQEIYDSDLNPNVSTFNSLIAGYVTAWMWDRMRKTYLMMKERSIKPNTDTFLLLLRGYAHSGNVKKMEEIYELGKHLFDREDLNLIRIMICAYCKSSCENRIEKIDGLIGLIPEQEYRPWLNVLLINVYAEAQLLERMENFINIAFQQRTAVHTVRVMRSIITVYYHSNCLEKLTSFIKRAEYAGWRICRSLYHCKMVMCASQNRLEEMENVLAEMEKSNIDRTLKTWSILYNAYLTWGQRYKFDQIRGVMCKKYETHLDDCIS